MLMIFFLLLINTYGPQIVMYYLYAYYTVESGIKQLTHLHTTRIVVRFATGRSHKLINIHESVTQCLPLRLAWSSGAICEVAIKLTKLLHFLLIVSFGKAKAFFVMLLIIAVAFLLFFIALYLVSPLIAPEPLKLEGAHVLVSGM